MFYSVLAWRTSGAGLHAGFDILLSTTWSLAAVCVASADSARPGQARLQSWETEERADAEKFVSNRADTPRAAVTIVKSPRSPVETKLIADVVTSHCQNNNSDSA